MDWLEKVYNDVDADLMIMAIDQLAERYGYTSDMDETIEIEQEDKWRCWETFESVINKSIRTYGSLPTAKRQEDFKTRIAAGYRLYEMESQPRQRVHRGKIWRVEVPTGVGSETTGMRYYGKIAYGRRKTTKIEGTRNEYHVVAQKEFDVYDGRHKAIVDEQLWKDAQAKRRATASKLEKKHDLDHEHVLSGLVKCPVCGAGLYGNVKRAKRKDGTYYKTYFSYACKHRLNKDGHKCDYHKQWSEEKVDNAVSEIIRKLVNNPRFSEVMKTKINTSVDTSEAEKELANAKKVLKQLIGTKDKIILQIDTLDILDKNYDRKYDDLQKRLDTIYDKISDAEDLVSETEDKLSNIQKDKITGDNIYNYLLMFDSVYDVLSDMEKKQFYNALLTDIQIYEEEQDKQIIKSIGFKFPVFYDGKFTKRIIRDKEKTVETVVLLSHKKPDGHINV